MAAPPQHEETPQTQEEERVFTQLISSYLGLSFTIFLGFLPKLSISLIPSLQSHNRALSFKLHQAESELKELYSRRKEDSKANARVVEIFATHRHAWQQEEKRLLSQIDLSAEEIAHLRGRVEELENMVGEFKSNVEELRREIYERDEMLSFLGKSCASGVEEEFEDLGSSRFEDLRLSHGGGVAADSLFADRGVQILEEMVSGYGQVNGFDSDFSNLSSKFWAERASPFQDVQYESLESRYHLKHYVSRRESPWKVDGESTGVSAKLKLLEQELLNLERIGKNDVSKVPSLMRKQAKRYQALAGKIDDLCQRMASDPCGTDGTPDFQTRRHTKFLVEAFRLQQRASETGQKLMALQMEKGNSYSGDEPEGQAKLTTRRSMDSIRNNFKEIQRNLEIWLARITGDVEGTLARDGASQVHPPGQKTRKSDWVRGKTDDDGDFLINLPSHLHGIPNLDKICHVQMLKLTLK